MVEDRSGTGSRQSRDQDLAGLHIGNYRIIKTLGQGGMGEVLLAEDERLPRKVAIKLLRSEYTANRQLLKRFSREAQAASALNHPNIVAIYDIGEAGLGRYIVMEYVEGRTLREARAMGASSQQIVEWAAQIARALRAAHAAGIVHRDIKPENILVRNDGYVKVLDFGLARRAAPRKANAGTVPKTDTILTETGQLVGTINYMSPEQGLGRATTSATDIFSLGIVFYEMLTGTHPFSAQTPVATLNAIVSQEPLNPTHLVPGMQRWLESLLMGMLAKDPGARPSAQQVLEELESAAHATAEIRTPSRPGRPFVGRRVERAALRSALKATDEEGGRVLCLAGEPGIGKTMLVEEFLSEVESGADQWLVGRGRCSERLSESEAYLPFLEALDNLLRTEGEGVFGRTLRTMAPTWYQRVSGVSPAGSGERAVSQERMKREITAFLRELTRHQPLVLFLDDLHWADNSTVDMLAYIASHLESIRLLIVATYRPTEMHLSHHPFLALKLDLTGRHLCSELEIAYLTVADVERYLELVFPGHAFSEQFARLVHARTGGNALFMSDLLHYLKDRGVIRPAPDGWTLAAPLGEVERNLPESVRSIIERKIGQLQNDDRKLLTAASIQGFDFDSAAVAQVLQADPADLEERLENLERIHTFVRFIEEQQFPQGTRTLRYRFVHVLYQNALYASIRPTRKKQLSLRMAETLLAFYGDRSQDIASNLAFLFETCQDFAQAANYSILAARNALQVFANKEAALLSRRALELLGTLPPSDTRVKKEIEAHMTLGVALVTLKGGSSAHEVEEAFGRALELCQAVGDDMSVFPALYGLWGVHTLRADLHQALELGERMVPIAKAAQNPMLLVMAYNSAGYVKPFLGDFAGAKRDLEEMLRWHNREIQESSFAQFGAEPKTGGLAALAWSHWALGFADKACQLMAEAREMTREVRHSVTVAGVKTWSALLAVDLEDFAEAKRSAEDALAYAKHHGVVQSIGHSHMCYGAALAGLGESLKGVEEFRNAIKVHEAIGCGLARTLILLGIAEALGTAGDLVHARETLSEARAFSLRTNELYRAPEFDRIDGKLHFLSLRRSELMHTTSEENRIIEAGENCLLSSIEIARKHQARSFELKTALDLASFRRMQGRLAEARVVLESTFNGFTEGFETPLLVRARRALDSLACL